MKKQLFSFFEVYLPFASVEAEDFSFETVRPQKFPVSIKFFRTTVVAFPVTFTRPFASATSMLSTLREVLPPDVLSPVLEISNAVDETEEVANISRSKSCTLVCPGVFIISFTHAGLCGGVHPIIFIPCLLFSSASSTSLGKSILVPPSNTGITRLICRVYTMHYIFTSEKQHCSFLRRKRS